MSHGVVKDGKSRCQAAFCPVGKGRRQQHRKPCQSNKGYLLTTAAVFLLVVWLGSDAVVLMSEVTPSDPDE